MLTPRSLRPLSIAALCLSTTACGEPSGSSAAPASSASARPAAPSGSAAAEAPVEKLPGFDLKATLAGAPVDFRNAIAYQRPGSDAVEVLVSTAPRGCDTPRKNGIAYQRGEVMFNFIVLEGLTPGGAPAWKVVETYFSGNTSLGTDKPATVERGDGTQPIKIGLQPLSLTEAGGEKKALEVQGTVVAKSCGVIPPPESGSAPPAARPQADLSLEVAGHKIALVGALYREGQKDLVLATMPMSCERSPYSQADVALLLGEDGKSANLQGRRIGTQTSGTLKPAAKVKAGKPEGGAVEIALDGDFKVGDWPVKVKGKASALVCAK